MKKLILLLLISSPVFAAEPSADCGLATGYQEMAARKVSTVADYQKLETDLLALNGKHASRVMRPPPSISIPVTADNVADKAADLQKVARARLERMGCH